MELIPRTVSINAVKWVNEQTHTNKPRRLNNVQSKEQVEVDGTSDFNWIGMNFLQL
ncbi:hypothetical protein SCARR_02535 [Pontiella sulfatireligans]|uniref:Uncharacterized protein n=1 Tax=Pontiella sulfatireligans TaxID=2750658 RepID=A0A6C2UJR3_9BACT|nr:hypothetical protein SCARR_02535 [Pontiella sulfatireligans]